MGMFTQEMEDSNGKVILPSTQLYWLYNTNQTQTVYDSEVPITTTKLPTLNNDPNRFNSRNFL